MVRTQLFTVLCAAGLFQGCGPADLQVVRGAHALSFRGDACAEAVGEPIAIGNAFTLEAFVRGDPWPSRLNASIIALGDAVMLWTDENSTGISEPSSDPQTGWQTELSLYDGMRHHVAAVWSADEGGALYLDGIRYGLGESLDVPEAAENIWIGCWPQGNRYFDGVIDEVRVSTIVRYPSNFEVPTEPFHKDEYTLALWHLDTGSGDAALEEMALFDTRLDGTTWTGGLIGPQRPASDDEDTATASE